MEKKFRAWDKKNKQWLLGYKEIGGFSLTGECVILGEFALLFRPLDRLNDIEITQFTGIKDEDNIEIYEGDIVEYVYSHPEDCSVKCKEVYPVAYEYDSFNISWGDIHPSKKVIGNIYENPELIKEQ